MYLVGSIIYTVASGLLLMMWQGNDFGGGLINQLNLAISDGRMVSIGPTGQEGVQVCVDKQLSIGGVIRGVSRHMSKTVENFQVFGSQDASTKKLSIRDVISLCMYCWLFVCTTANFVLGILLLQSGERSFSDVAMTLIWVLGVKVVLLVHSAITTVPNEQPHRFAMQSMWFLLFFAAIVQTVSLFSSIPLGTAAPLGGLSAGAASQASAGHLPPAQHGGEL